MLDPGPPWWHRSEVGSVFPRIVIRASAVALGPRFSSNSAYRMNAVAGRAGSLVLAAALVAGPFTSCIPHRAQNGERAGNTLASRQSYVAQFDSLWKRFDELYPSFDYKGIDWDAQREIGRAHV